MKLLPNINAMWWLPKLTLARLNALVNGLIGTYFGGALPGGATTVTGTTVETLIYSQVIPAHSVGPRGVILMRVLCSTTVSNTNTKTFRLKLGGVTLASGSLTSVLTAGSTYVIYAMGAENSQASHPGLFTAQTTTGSALATSSIDMTVDQTLSITVQLQNSADNATLVGANMQVLTAYGGA